MFRQIIQLFLMDQKSIDWTFVFTSDNWDDMQDDLEDVLGSSSGGGGVNLAPVATRREEK